MGERGFYARRRSKVSHDHHQADHNQPDNGDDFNHREPELHLTEHFYGGEVKAQQQNNYRQRGNPVRQSGEPELRIGRNGDNVGHPGNHPAEPVGPASKVPRPRPKKVGRKVAKGFVFEIREQQFTHCTHHEKEHKADDHIDKNDRRTRKADGFA